MASSKLSLICHTDQGAFSLKDLDKKSTVLELKIYIASRLNCDYDKLSLKFGYPPSSLYSSTNSLTLEDVNLKPDEVITVGVCSSQVAFSAEKGYGDKSAQYEQALQRASGVMMKIDMHESISSLFMSIFYSISSGELKKESNIFLRKVIAKRVNAYAAKYTDTFLGMTNKDYRISLVNNHHIGGKKELKILSDYLSMEIVSVNTINVKYQRFGKNEKFLNRILLLRDDAQYYPLVIKLPNGFIQTIFPVNDQHVIKMALEVARQSKPVLYKE